MAPSNKTMLFVSLLVAALAVGVPVAQGQLGGIIGLLTGLLNIQGTLFCSANLSANVSANGVILSPPLANATVQLRCGAGNGTVVASVQTNSQGQFSILLDPLSITLTQLLSECRVVVATPIVGCNATLPTGILSAPLSFAGNTLSGLLTITNLIPSLFTFILGA